MVVAQKVEHRPQMLIYYEAGDAGSNPARILVKF